MDKQTAKRIQQNAWRYLEQGYHCSEAILLAVGEGCLPEVDPLALRIATPFAGGIGGGHMEVCGALSGGIMLIGALYGRSDALTNDDHCLAQAAEFRERFLREFGFTTCQALKDNWVGQPGQESCKELTARAAEILIDLLEAE